MDASLEMMAALMIVLGVITLAIVAYLVWGMRKKKKAKSRRFEAGCEPRSRRACFR